MVQPVLQIPAHIEADDSGTRRRKDFLEARGPVKHGEIGGDRRSEGCKRRDEDEEFAQDHNAGRFMISAASTPTIVALPSSSNEIWIKVTAETSAGQSSRID